MVLRRSVLQSLAVLVILFGAVIIAPTMALSAAGDEHSTHSSGEHAAAVASEKAEGPAGHHEGSAAPESDDGWILGANITAAIAVILFLVARGRRRESIPGNPNSAKSADGQDPSLKHPTRLSALDRIFRSPLYPIVPQAAVIGVFVYILFALLFGSSNPSNNFGSVMVWIMWWPVIPITFVLAGRFWCSLCPWGALSDWLQTHLSLGLKVPKVIKKYGIWVIFGGFMFITWYDLAFGLTTSATATITVLLVVAVLALITSVLFERRVWCRYLCPLGGIFGNYSQAAIVEFRGTPEKCATCSKHACYKGAQAAPGCPLIEFPLSMESNRLCNLCGNCVKNCENGSPKLKWRLPGKELWEKRDGRLDEAVLASVLVGVILMAGFGMLEFWQAWVTTTSTYLGIPEWVIVTIAYIAAALAGLGLSILASAFSARGTTEGTWANLTRYGYALIPLNLATHISHNMFHFLGEGKTIGTVSQKLVGIGPAYAAAAGHASGGHGAAALVSPAGIRWVQFTLMGLGIAASILVTWKIARRGTIRRETAPLEASAGAGVATSKSSIWRGFGPQLAVITMFSFVSFMLFVLPMAARH